MRRILRGLPLLAMLEKVEVVSVEALLRRL